jgi:hypothetical protein
MITSPAARRIHRARGPMNSNPENIRFAPLRFIRMQARANLNAKRRHRLRDRAIASCACSNSRQPLSLSSRARSVEPMMSVDKIVANTAVKSLCRMPRRPVPRGGKAFVRCDVVLRPALPRSLDCSSLARGRKKAPRCLRLGGRPLWLSISAAVVNLRRARCPRTCPLSHARRTSKNQQSFSQFDPKRTYTGRATDILEEAERPSMRIAEANSPSFRQSAKMNAPPPNAGEPVQ